MGGNTEGFEHIRTTRLGSNGAIAVFGDDDAGGGAEDGGGGGNVEGAQAIAAGADDIEDFPGASGGIQREGDGFIVQGADESRDFIGGFAFLGQGAQEIGFEGDGNGFGGEAIDGLPDLVAGQGVTVAELLDERFEHGHMLRLGGAVSINLFTETLLIRRAEVVEPSGKRDRGGKNS